MSSISPEQITEAIDKALANPAIMRHSSGHADHLARIVARHKTETYWIGHVPNRTEVTECSRSGENWPCPDVADVIDVLTGWGVL